MKFIKKIILGMAIGLLPALILAEGLVTCEGANCGFLDVINTIQEIIKFLLVIASIFAAVAFMYAGFLYLFSMGNPGKISQAHGIFKKVVIGYIIMLSAWVAVYALEQALGVTYESYLTPPSTT